MSTQTLSPASLTPSVAEVAARIFGRQVEARPVGDGAEVLSQAFSSE